MGPPLAPGLPLPVWLCVPSFRLFSPYMGWLVSGSTACRLFVLQVDLESILQSPDGKPQNFTEATALRAFSLHCRLSIHLQHKVREPGAPSQKKQHIAKASSVTDFSFCRCWTVLLRRKSVPVHFGRHGVLVRKQSFVFYSRSRRRIPEAS